MEAALTLPLTIFLVLGVLQLFMMLQARVMAQYAAYKAVRAGSLSYGDCSKMSQAALAALLPTITATDTAAKLGTAFNDRWNPTQNPKAGYKPSKDAGYNQQILEILREKPLGTDWTGPEDTDFDAPRAGGAIDRLEIRMVYWYRLRIPFADWVMARMFLATFGLQKYTAQNPLIETQKANWNGSDTIHHSSGWPGGDLGDNMKAWAGGGQYLFPIQVTAAMRMMTPPKRKFFANQGCPL